MTTTDLECWRCGGEGEAFALPAHPDGGGTICHGCWGLLAGGPASAPRGFCPECGRPLWCFVDLDGEETLYCVDCVHFALAPAPDGGAA